MTLEERNKAQKRIIEEMGIYFEKKGFSPISGRVMGLLMVMDKEEYTFDEIVSELQISKSSASHALKNLELRKDIEYITKPGERKRYFRIRRQDVPSMLDHFENETKIFADFLERMIHLKTNKNSDNVKFYKQTIEVLKHLMSNLKAIKAKYRKNNMSDTNE
jgi:DNA-binding transcriptional regulator GbsR (MarR family)